MRPLSAGTGPKRENAPNKVRPLHKRYCFCAGSGGPHRMAKASTRTWRGKRRFQCFSDPTIKSLLDAAKAFPMDVDPVKGHPVPIMFHTQRYARVANHGDEIDVEARQAGWLIDDLATNRDPIESRIRDHEFVHSNPALFAMVDMADIQRRLDVLRNAKTSDERIAEDVAVDRFRDLSNYHPKDLTKLPVAPQIAAGT